MSQSETEDYYAYSSDEDAAMDENGEEVEDEEYGVDDEEQDDESQDAGDLSQSSATKDNNNSKTMDWDVSSNPNAAPTSHNRHHPVVVAAPPVKSGIRILDSKNLKPEMNARVKELTEVLGVSAAAAGMLLREYQYSKERVLEQYMVDADAVLKKCGVYHRVVTTTAPMPQQQHPLPAASRITRSKSDKSSSSSIIKTTWTCPICYDEMAKSASLSMPCGHAFCLDCWGDFCANAIAEGPSCVTTLTCPQAGCTERVSEEEFAMALGCNGGNNNNQSSSNSLLMVKYTEFQLRNFVESNPLTRWCPGRGCERVACAESTAAMESENNLAHCTKCLSHFCMVCGIEPHAPVSCKHLLTWTEKCRNESETANWILANTKSCPKCVSRIEKNQGCNHMTCQRCKFEFCWICMTDWKDHGANTGGYYKCSRYRDGNEDPASDSARAKRDLDRYLHYYRRFHAHQEAEKFALKQLKETEQRMVALQEASDDAKWTDVEFLKTANMQLVECRRVLKYTYVFAYYLNAQQTAARDRFEHHQEMLERFTEHLSELSEMPLAEMDRTDVVNKTRVVDRFMKNVLKYVEDGMEED